MIGCLGGLGRSISKWMVKRGVRKFVFMGRSGTDRKPAHLLVEDLKASGCEVLVARGDVGRYADVQKAVSIIEGPIGGVVQAAMGLNVRSHSYPFPAALSLLFYSLSYSAWINNIYRKLCGLVCRMSTGIQVLIRS